ncbi:DNA methyltransferase 1-associated protein 1 [Bagarius yarrelli]|uniref:E3 ubiquitin-protein ligase RNF220 n=1 Tax=Bagarius yarrelli TaxID=175774 RepID=A0A556VCQ1_BAGYA|nr:DNA methyltransferase 1-associated protein 1 [Bagarius yarrelli]
MVTVGSDTTQGYRTVKAKLGCKKVRPWKWMPFTNPARKDGATFYHWRRAVEEGKDYPFSRFNKKRSVEDLKERYYNICGKLTKVRAPAGTEPKVYIFDAGHERRRKEQLERLFNRTPEQAVPETAGIKFPDFKSAGVSLRSQRPVFPVHIKREGGSCVLSPRPHTEAVHSDRYQTFLRVRANRQTRLNAVKSRIRDLEKQLTRGDRIKCLICMDSYTIPLASIQCWHVHCEECWLRTLGAKKLCPQCNTITSPGDLRRVYL